MLSGPVTTDEPNDTATAAMTVHTLQIGLSDEPLDKTLRAFSELEAFGVQPLKDETRDSLLHTIELKEGRYQVFLPWKEFHQPLPDNKDLSLCRLNGLLQRLRRNPTILEEYNTIIQDQLAAGIIERVEHFEQDTLLTTSCCSEGRQGHQ